MADPALSMTITVYSVGRESEPAIRRLLAESGLDADVRLVEIQHYGSSGGSHWNAVITSAEAISAAVVAIVFRGLRSMFGSTIKLDIQPGKVSMSVRDVSEIPAVESFMQKYFQASKGSRDLPEGDSVSPEERTEQNPEHE